MEHCVTRKERKGQRENGFSYWISHCGIKDNDLHNEVRIWWSDDMFAPIDCPCCLNVWGKK